MSRLSKQDRARLMQALARIGCTLRRQHGGPWRIQAATTP